MPTTSRPPVSTARTRLLVTLTVLVALLPIGGGVWVWEGVATALMARESRGWPVAQGLVTSADSNVDASTPPLTLSRDYGRWRRWQHQHITYNTAVTVRYVVADSTYTSSTRTFGQTLGSGDGSDAELVRRRYPVGALVPVRYAPMDPSLAVLEPGFSAEALGLPLVGFAINLVVLLFVLFFFISITDRPYLRVPIALFGLVFQLAGFGLLAYLLPTLWREIEAAGWPTVPGRIVYGAPIDTAGTHGTPADSAELVQGRDPTRVVFRYVVADTVRFARQTVRDPAYDAEGRSSHAVWPFGLGHHLPVHVDPDDSARAVVNTGLLARHGWTAGIALAAILFGWIAQVLGRQVDAPFAGGGARPLRSAGRGGI
jgi:hypothetical protein